MRALAGPAMLLVIVGSIGLYRGLQKPEGPSREFLDLEFAGADAEHTGSCYSLSTVLIASSAFSDATLEWKRIGDVDDEDGENDRWQLAIEDLVHDGNSTAHVFQHYTFERHDPQVRLVSVEASEGQSTQIKDHVDALVQSPNDVRSTPVKRCQDPGATGYKFKRKREKS